MHLSRALFFALASLVSAGLPVALAVSSAQWNALNVSVNGRLFQGTPFARPCFQSAFQTGGALSAQKCSLIEANYTTRDLRVQEFGSYMNTEWETCQSTSQQCLLDSSRPNDTKAFVNQTCFQGSVPAYYIDAESSNDIIAGFKFSRATGVPLVVKNTGHDYKGRSSGAGTLAIWTHNFQTLSYNTVFVPAGCPSSSAKPAVTIGAGVRHSDLYAFADANNITVPGGTDPSVGAAGGYFQGGGHSAFSSVFGLAVDRALEIEVVIPSGEVLIANECQNTDLFFALRGGGGGTFGVVLNVTELALPAMKIPTIVTFFTNTTANQKLFMSFLAENMIEFAQQGWGGFIAPTTGFFLFVNPKMPQADAVRSMQGMQSFVQNQINGTFESLLTPSWLDFFNTFLVPTNVAVGVPFAVTSRLIPKTNFETSQSQTELVDTLMTLLSNLPQSIIFSVGPSFFADNGGSTNVTSVNPIWYKSLWHVTTSELWNFDTTFEQRLQFYTALTKDMDPLRAITPGSGAYQNEADVYEPNHTESYWGTNYPRLLSIKEKYDPDHLLDCWNCVGSNENDSKFACYMPPDLVRP